MEAWSEANPLNGREREVLRFAGEGRSAIGKLGVGNRIEASRLARQKAWL